MARRPTSFGLLLSSLVVAVGCSRRTPVATGDAAVVPTASAAVELDGEWNEPDWDRIAMRGVFSANGAEARPFSEVRMLHDKATLYVTLYAADENVLSSELFDLSIGSFLTHINPQGHLVPDVPGVRAVGDLDGTLDDERDSDEEWVIELAVPISATGVSSETAVPVRANRCDVPHDAVLSCGAWDGSIILGGRSSGS